MPNRDILARLEGEEKTSASLAWFWLPAACPSPYIKANKFRVQGSGFRVFWFRV